MNKTQRKQLSLLLAGVVLSLGLCSCGDTSGTKDLPSSGTSNGSSSVVPTPSFETPSLSDQTPPVSPASSETPSASSVFTDTPTPENPLEYKHYSYEFRTDLSEYEQYMDPQGSEYLLLVNADHPLSRDFVPGDLVDVVNTRSDRSEPFQLRKIAEKALEALFIEAEECGILYTQRVYSDDGKYYYENKLGVTSGYRSYNTQEWLFNYYVEQRMKEHPDWTEEEAIAYVKLSSCPPGTSEHQTGLCVDMHNWPSADRDKAKDFAASEAGKWLQENCYKFGFVLRFPEDKTDITGILYESWHFRYVGRYHATRMKELGMCLEEYVEYLMLYGYDVNQGRG